MAAGSWRNNDFEGQLREVSRFKGYSERSLYE